MSCRDVGPSWLAACLGVVLLAGGCERPTTLVPVKGRVLLDGKPLPSGVVQFQPASGQSASGQIADDGSFMLSRNALGDGNGGEGIGGTTQDKHFSDFVVGEPCHHKIRC